MPLRITKLFYFCAWLQHDRYNLEINPFSAENTNAIKLSLCVNILNNLLNCHLSQSLVYLYCPSNEFCFY